MSKTITLNITVVIFAGPNVSTLRFDHVSNHIIDQSVFVPDLLGFEFRLVSFFINLLEDIFESAIVLFQDGVFGGHVQWVFSFKGELETAVSKTLNALINIVHTQTDTTFSFELEHFHSLLFSFSVLENEFESSWSVDDKICGFVLVAECVSADDDGLFPAWDEPGDVFDDDWFSEDGSVEDVSDGSIGRFPHLFEVELFDSGLIGSDGGTLDTNFALFDGVGGIDGDLIVGGISVFDTEIEVLDVEIEEGVDEFVLDGGPDDSGHLITIELSDWVFDFNFFKLHQKRYFNWIRYVDKIKNGWRR